jgi:hypothetical protein
MQGPGPGTFVSVTRPKRSVRGEADVSQAGAIILKEVGGFFSGGKDLFERDAPVGEVILGRRYICIRAVPPTEVSRPERRY